MKTWSTLLRGGLISSAVVMGLVVGCQIQREGERCSLFNGSNDCQDPLVCTAASSLSADDGVNRCCPDGGTITDDRCRRRVTGSGGMGGMGGETNSAGGSSNTGGSASGGSSSTQCQYNSDCDDGLVCGPTGRCQLECKDDVDCDDGFRCDAEGSCVAQ